MCFKQKFRRICEIINIVHSRGMLEFVFVLMYCIICFVLMESNKKLLKNKKMYARGGFMNAIPCKVLRTKEKKKQKHALWGTQE